MNTVDMIRAWKDAEYRESLSEAERAALPANPAGMVDVAEEDLAAASGGRSYFTGTCGRVCEILTPQYGCDLTY